METGLVLQYLVIALAALLSLWVVVKKQFPGTVRRLRGGLALALVRPGRPVWMQALGRRIAPPAGSSAGACGGCHSCGPSAPKQH